MKFRKRVVEPGRYHSPDGVIDIPRERIIHWKNQFDRMKAAGITVPVPYGHVSTAVPRTQAERDHLEAEKTKTNAGFVENLRVTASGALEAEIDVPLASDAERFGTTIKECSPWLHPSFKDGAGNVWNDCIAHLAAVQQGVAAGQTNFEPIHQPTIGMRLSLAGHQAFRFAIEDKMADEPDMTPGNDTSPSPTDPTFDLNDMSDEKPVESTTKPQLVALLGEAGLPIGDYTTLEDLEAKLIVALGVKKAHHNANPTDTDDMEPPLAQVQPANDAGALTMSLGKNPLAMSLFKRAEASEKKTITDRANALYKSGRITPQMLSMLQPKVDGFRLSLNDDGAPKAAEIHSHLNLLERLPAGAAWPAAEKAKRMGLEEVAVPSEMTAGMLDADGPKDIHGKPLSAEETQALIDQLAGRTRHGK